MKILANDGISNSGKEALETAGFEVITTTVAQEQLSNFINTNNIEALLVRSATQVKSDVIDACPGLKLIGRGGVGMDNIAVDYAKSKNIAVVNTPAASSQSVAELVFAHLFGGVRFLHDANRNMPLEGDTRFKALKKSYSKGSELRGKTLGIIGIGRIGKEVAKIGLGIGMNVIVSDKLTEEATVKVELFNGQGMDVNLKSIPLNDLLKQSDFITIHVPSQKEYIIGKNEIDLMKKGVGIINASRGGVIHEVSLVEALNNNKVGFAGIDTFESEPTPSVQILMNPNASLSPHIGAATTEAQDRIGLELADQIIERFK
ncbi:MAG: 3-phosphoglycerate dehydrogenase [Bacteroidetes bacterium MedPE-SWsnd-G2]|nr:MAG: 3-phosphoglycerate dehydrogenase [Bacteroidetes bacterium MedPE-SWsnd-G2]